MRTARAPRRHREGDLEHRQRQQHEGGRDRTGQGAGRDRGGARHRHGRDRRPHGRDDDGAPGRDRAGGTLGGVGEQSGGGVDRGDRTTGGLPHGQLTGALHRLQHPAGQRPAGPDQVALDAGHPAVDREPGRRRDHQGRGEDGARGGREQRGRQPAGTARTANADSGARTRSCWSSRASTSSTTAASTSPRRRPSRPGRQRHQRVVDLRPGGPASSRSAASWATSRSAYRSTGRARPKVADRDDGDHQVSTGGCCGGLGDQPAGGGGQGDARGGGEPAVPSRRLGVRPARPTARRTAARGGQRASAAAAGRARSGRARRPGRPAVRRGAGAASVEHVVGQAAAIAGRWATTTTVARAAPARRGVAR